MASVFTYDPDPPRISSPWSDTPVSTPKLLPIQDGDPYTLGGLIAPTPFLLEGSGISKLDAEPQDGPTEYKLHLLLRARKGQVGIPLPTTMSAVQQLKHRTPSIQSSTTGRLSLRTSSGTPPLQVRQKRLEHLTTQLLWRLQQSSPYHSQSTLRLVPPALPESEPILSLPSSTGKLVPGLEESKGALYEIGVADDGEFVGLTKEEMDESLINLRSMAASLGCKVEILRTVIVGECGMDETSSIAAADNHKIEKLWVVEVLVLPDTHHHTSADAPRSLLEIKNISTNEGKEVTQPLELADSHTAQLRVSLTGSTTSGKSSLVGTLSTSTLDSGRGKTRLSLLKHRHEIESGVTSSVAPELIGYQTVSFDPLEVKVVNYRFGNTSSWNDIHNAAEGERLVFLLDSAGHPRYRRTTIRGLVSWAPHWTLCCVVADNTENFAFGQDSSFGSDEILGSSKSFVELSRAHLELCLSLGLRLIVVITKLDIASNSGLRNTVSKILSAVKAAGRSPVLLKPNSGIWTSDELQTLSQADISEVEAIFDKNDPNKIVPIVLTSAVKGSGIRQLHALLRCAPILEEAPDTHSEADDAVFYIDEVFAKNNSTPEPQVVGSVNILSGHLCFRDLEVGDQVLVGPYTSDIPESAPVEFSRARSYPLRMAVTSLRDLSRSAPKVPTLATLHANLVDDQSATQKSAHKTTPLSKTSLTQPDEWLQARITSIRNLRLPLRRLLAGQVGTIGIELLSAQSNAESDSDTNASVKFRKGMVLLKQSPTSLPPHASLGLKITLPSSAYLLMEPGALFTIYVASIRALAKITSVEVPQSPVLLHTDSNPQQTSTNSAAAANYATHEDDTVFLFDDPDSVQPEITYSDSGRREVRYQPPLSPDIEVSFSFVAGKEWVRTGSKVLVMSTSVAEGGSGLDGVVGVVSEVF